MQIISTPKEIIHHLECYQRQFLWGSSAHKGKLHLIHWNIVTKKQGGLGIQDLQINAC